MAIRGGKGKVQFFILPSDRLLGFTNGTYGENDYQPFMELAVAFENNQLNWSLGGKAITIDAIDPLAKELFGDLIHVASGTMSDSELFAHPTTELKSGETLAVGYQAPAVVPEDSTIIPGATRCCNYISRKSFGGMHQLYAGNCRSADYSWS